MSELKTNKVSPATGTALAVGDSGDTITVPSGATLDISASTLTPPATMPASSGVNFTALNATNLGSGTVPTARLGSGTADATTFLRGDQSYAAAGGGKVVQIVKMTDSTNEETTTASYQDSDYTLAITPASSSNIIVAICNISARSHRPSAADVGGKLRLYNSTDGVVLAESRFAVSGSSTNWDLQFGQCLIGYDTGRSVATTYLLQYYAYYTSTMIVGYGDYPGSLILLEIEP